MNWKSKRQPTGTKPSLFTRHTTKRINASLKSSISEVITPRSQPSSPKMAAPNGDVPSMEARRCVEEESKKAVTSFVGMYLIVAACVAAAWVLGYFEFSFLWVFITIASLFMIWKAKIGKIIAQHLSNEEAVLYRKRAFRQDETAEWFNFLLNRWWVFSSANIEELVKKRLDERLWDIRPSFVDGLELTTFSVGEQTPNIKNVRTFECSESTPGSLQPISWFNVHRPPVGLDKLSTYQVVVECDLSMISDDFKMIFRGRIGSSKVNVSFDLVVEDLHLCGTMQAIIVLSMDIPFPHVSKATVCFKERPDVTFNIRMLRALSLMEIPLLKSWIHNNVMEGFTKAMVDPASVDIQIKKVGPTLIGQKSTKKEKAQGVLTIRIQGYPPKDAAAEDIRYTVLNIGERKRQTHEVPATEEWKDVCSFFIYNLATERIRVKSKCKRLLTSTTLEQSEINLSSFPFQVQPTCETEVENKDGSKMVLKMQYTPLPAINLTDMSTDNTGPKTSSVAGVLYVRIHGATNVLAADKTGASDPYCVLFCDRRRILTTPFIPRTRNPHWESWVEFFVADYTRNTLSFFVYDWDGTNTINDDFLGSVHVNLSDSQPEIIKKTMTLGYNRPAEGFTVDKNCGQITVSIIFRPVPSVAKSEKFRNVMQNYRPNDYLYEEDLMSPSSVIPAGMPGRRSTTAAYMDELLSDKVIVELTILQGKDMVAMDRNGYSDPFCVVSVKGKKIHTTQVKKKTLFPKWNETVTTELSLFDAPNVTIDVFDKDVISKDFMGALTLSVEQLKELSIKGTSDWYTLEKIKSGKLQLKCHVISKDIINKMNTSQGANEVFQYPDVSGSRHDVTDSSFGSPNTSMEQNHLSPVRRSTSELALDQASAEINGDAESATIPRRKGKNSNMKRADSTNSVMHRISDGASQFKLKFRRRSLRKSTLSLDSSASMTDRLFSIAGKILRVRGDIPQAVTEVYCKVRLDVPSNRLSLFHHPRIIAKSDIVPVTGTPPAFNLGFEVDRGAGVSSDAQLIFDLKQSARQHLATKGFTLKSLLADADGSARWLPIGNGFELELTLSQGVPSPSNRGRSGSSLKSSFRKEKQV